MGWGMMGVEARPCRVVGLRAAPVPTAAAGDGGLGDPELPAVPAGFPHRLPGRCFDKAHRFAPGEQQDLRLPPTRGLPPPLFGCCMRTGGAARLRITSRCAAAVEGPSPGEPCAPLCLGGFPRSPPLCIPGTVGCFTRDAQGWGRGPPPTHTHRWVSLLDLREDLRDRVLDPAPRQQ